MTDDPKDYESMPERGEFNLSRMPPHNLLSRRSKVVEIKKYDEETGEWRMEIRMSREKFDDEAKGVFLHEFMQWGRMGDSAAAAGVSTQTVRAHMEKDPEFAEAMKYCEDHYRDKLIGHHQDLVFNGTVKESYDRNGNLVSRERIYPIRLIELELKKHDSGYREKQEIDVNVKRGVVVAPAEMKTVEDWRNKFSGVTIEHKSKADEPEF